MSKITPDMLNESIRGIPLPQNMLERPVSGKGFPVPYFAAKVGDDWDFRVVHPETTIRCMRLKLCWLCGQQLGRVKAFVVGPMCVITKTSAEPPSHPSCARYAAIACPFLASPRMKRNEVDLPEGHQPPAGVGIMRNPGVTAVLITETWDPFSDGQGGVLIRMGRPTVVEWYAQRRAATQTEVVESIKTGLPALVEQCNKEETPAEQRAAFEELGDHLAAALLLLPPAAPGEKDVMLEIDAIRKQRAGDAVDSKKQIS